jgi:hypothetical protein
MTLTKHKCHNQRFLCNFFFFQIYSTESSIGRTPFENTRLKYFGQNKTCTARSVWMRHLIFATQPPEAAKTIHIKYHLIYYLSCAMKNIHNVLSTITSTLCNKSNEESNLVDMSPAKSKFKSFERILRAQIFRHVLQTQGCLNFPTLHKTNPNNVYATVGYLYTELSKTSQNTAKLLQKNANILMLKKYKNVKFKRLL